jgi:hypothetical protein
MVYIGKHGPSPKAEKPLDHKAHLRFQHELPCSVPNCNASEVQVHHLLRVESRHGQYRAGDQDTVPLCYRHHIIDLHQGEGSEGGFEKRHGIKLAPLAKQLFANTGDFDKCLEILESAKGEQAMLACLIHSGGDAGRQDLAADGGLNAAMAALKAENEKLREALKSTRPYTRPPVRSKLVFNAASDTTKETEHD